MNIPAISVSQGNRDSVRTTLELTLTQLFPDHPFESGITRENAEPILSEYLAMSQAFPYLQAGAQKEFIFRCIDSNSDIPSDVEQTSAVGSFLTWDEYGGNWLLLQKGMKALPELLSTERLFHSNLLKADLLRIFSKPIRPHYSPTTANYLYQLYDGLSHSDSVVRVATMVAFEAHAEKMLRSLWQSLVAVFNINKDELTYFAIHVGGEDPAEKYHVQMTSQMVHGIVPKQRMRDFFSDFILFYRLNSNWCRSLITVNA